MIVSYAFVQSFDVGPNDPHFLDCVSIEGIRLDYANVDV